MRTKRRVVPLAVAAAAMLALAIASAGAAQTAPQVVASGLDNPRHLTFSPDGELYVVEAGRGGSITCGVEHPALGSSCFGFTGAVTLVRDNGADSRVVTGLPSIAGETEALGPSDIAFTGSQKYVLSIGLGGNDALKAAYGPQAGLLGDPGHRQAQARTASRCSPTCWPTRWRPTPTAPTSTPTRSGWSATATATSWPTPAATPSCGHRTRAPSPRSRLAPRAAPSRRRSWACRPARRSRRMPCRRRWCRGPTARTTSAS